MKGTIFNLVEDAVTDQHGEDVWDQVISDAGVSGVYTALGDYPHTELLALVAAGSRLLGVGPDDLLREIGPTAVRQLFDLHPHFVTPFHCVHDFLLTLNDVIHVEVRKLHPGAQPPEFWFEELPGGLTVHYRSARPLCALAEGMIQGAARHFGEEATLTHLQCAHDGADHCVIEAVFSADAGTR